MKKLITALVATILTITSMPAQANIKNKTASVPTLAVLDTALDTSIPEIKSRLIGEVCILDWPSCSNGTKFMEGAGAASIPLSLMANRDMNHGTQMVSAAIRNNPNMNILFVRIIGNTSRGTRQTTSINTVPNALKWIYENRNKYNVKAISMSQGHHNLLKGSNYCPVTQTDYYVQWFNAVNIPVFFPSGNSSDTARIDWPACIPGSIAVGGAEDFGSSGFATSRISNYDAKLIDFWAPIQARILFPGGLEGSAFGTSVSTQIAAARWLALSTLKPTLTIDQLIALIRNTSTPITNSIKQDGLMINLDKAING